MGLHPGNPVTRFAATIASHARQITRAHTRLDSVQSTQGQHTAQITAANTSIAANTTGIASNTASLTALDTRLGGSTHEAYLGTLAQAAGIGSQAHSGVGTISGTPTDVEFNAVNTALNNLVDAVNTLNGRLVASGILH